MEKMNMKTKEYHSPIQVSAVLDAFYALLSELKEQSGWDKETEAVEKVYWEIRKETL